jgi:hypothetical protein
MGKIRRKIVSWCIFQGMGTWIFGIGIVWDKVEFLGGTGLILLDPKILFRLTKAKKSSSVSSKCLLI